MRAEGKRGGKREKEVAKMSHRRRGGFTLVELLTVVAIIGMLVALLMPAVMGSREKGRQAKCTNHQKELGTAVLQYETSKDRFPGYINQFRATSSPTSWVVMVLSDLGRKDLWREYRDGGKDPVQVDQLVCPSDLEWEGQRGRLSYVANCGLDDANSPTNEAYNGVFHNHSSAVPPNNQVRLLWTETGEKQVGFLWKPQGSGAYHGPVAGKPSSNHPGGIMVTFCDGHAQFLHDDIDYRVYQHLMTPDSSRAGVPGVLGEDDY
jgi:prepilin-type N-terminal cleavage/methylation domain-containing protein/prepilin-type processing-associated H-X9-DG protein